MVRSQRASRSSPANNRETVKLCVFGPKSIIPRTVTVETNLSNNWLTFFVDELELNVPLDQGIFVCSSEYRPSNPKLGKGWRSNLNEPIRNFINCFEQNRKKHTVRICRPSNFSGKPGREAPRTPRARSSTSGPNVQGRTQSTPDSSTQRNRSVDIERSPSPQGLQPSIVIPTTTSILNASNISGVLTPGSEQSRDDTRLHEQSILQSDRPEAPQEIPAKRQKRSRKQTIVPRQQETPAPLVVKQEVLQPEDVVPIIKDVRSILKIELPTVTAISEQFYDEDDELEVDVSCAEMEGDSGSDANVLGGSEEQGLGVVEESGDQRQRGYKEEMENRGDGFGTKNDTIDEVVGASWERNDNQDEEGDEDDDDWDDAMSTCTALTQEETQLRQDGIEVGDIQPVVTGRFTIFSKVCDFLQKLFKEKNRSGRLK